MAAELYLLDTNVLIALMTGRDLGLYIDRTYSLRASRQRSLICSVSHGELRALAHVNGFGDAKREAIRTMLDSLITVDIGTDAIVDGYVKVYAALRGHPKGARTNIGENDMWIAATALAAGATLLTTDQHFLPLFTGVVKGIYIPTTSRLPGGSAPK